MERGVGGGVNRQVFSITLHIKSTLITYRTHCFELVQVGEDVLDGLARALAVQNKGLAGLLNLRARGWAV